MKITTYNGNDIFHPLCFNLYRFNDRIDFEKSKNSLLKEFTDEFMYDIMQQLRACGLRLHNLKWFSPKEYNYTGDSIDMEVYIASKRALKKAILQNKEEIDKKLIANKSYDGYIATTVDSVDDELKNLANNKDYEVDTIVLQILLSTINFGERFMVTDFICWDNECDSCEDDCTCEK